MKYWKLQKMGVRDVYMTRLQCDGERRLQTRLWKTYTRRQPLTLGKQWKKSILLGI